MRKIRAISLILLTQLSCLTLFSQEKGAVLNLDRKEIKIGEQIKADIKLIFPVTENYTFTSIADTLTKEIEIVEFGKIDTTYEGQNLSMKVMTASLLLTSFDTGYHPIPPIQFYSATDSISTEPQLIHVVDVEVDMPQSDGQSEPEIAIKDIKDIQDKDFSLWEWFKINKYFFLGALLLLATIWAYFKYIHPKLKNKEVSIIPQKKEDPAFKIALKKLNDVDNEKLWQGGKVKQYHSSLSEIIREYIERQFNIPALESTTGEINTALINNNFNDDVVKEVCEMLELSDLVKFAKMQPLGDENQKSMIQAKSFIEKTKPIESPEEKEESKEKSLNV